MTAKQKTNWAFGLAVVGIVGMIAALPLVADYWKKKIAEMNTDDENGG